MPAPTPSVLILAGRRAGTIDPLARAAGVSHKALVPVAGRPMIAHVLATISTALPEAPLLISTEDETALAAIPLVADLARGARLRFVPAQASLVGSIAAGAAAAGTPLLVTTADAVLLTADAIRALVAAGAEADALVTLVRAEQARAAHPDARPTAYGFADGRFVNCNLFWAGTPAALAAADAFRHGGQFVKVPLRIVRTFGLVNLLRFARRRHTLEQAFAIISAKLGADVRPLVLDDGRLAIDVDHARSLRIAEELLG